LREITDSVIHSKGGTTRRLLVRGEITTSIVRLWEKYGMVKTFHCTHPQCYVSFVREQDNNQDQLSSRGNCPEECEEMGNHTKSAEKGESVRYDHQPMSQAATGVNRERGTEFD